MRMNKLKVPPGRVEQAIAAVKRYNSAVQPVTIEANSDAYGVDWLDDYTSEKLFPGPVCLRMKSEYRAWPSW